MKLKTYLKFISILVAFCINISFALSDELIKYSDENGRSFYVDSLEKVPLKFRTSIKNPSNKSVISRVKSGRVQLYDKKHYEVASTKKPKLEIFVATWCGYCRILERDLNAARIPFQKYDIEHDPIGKKTYAEMGGGGIPIIRIDNKKILHGYSSLDELKANF